MTPGCKLPKALFGAVMARLLTAPKEQPKCAMPWPISRVISTGNCLRRWLQAKLSATSSKNLLCILQIFFRARREDEGNLEMREFENLEMEYKDVMVSIVES